ncbi:MBL fold metallo-hydrolase [Anaerosporomusa subterranea]|uniref:MBL fold metallo-hydrolase n=1 Tax=Anaerosporomusa subterranea TaxID=1794912 RepID=A0A154BQ15_ANASB|nr:MBL fold metallo-hydrolase [Anaerosporomusa subterranea]KYZ76047.1 MBL fold metallo-hydrolase [Anaerosporomusa subterranea]
MKIKFLGSGDAFGSGGRLQTCILISTEDKKILLDCGASSQIAIRKFNVNPNEISTIFLTHLHGDHFAGIPFFILDAQLISKRTSPLVIAGPSGTERRIIEAMEVLFPGSSTSQKKFELRIEELPLQQASVIDGVKVTPFPVVHPSGNPSTALRAEFCGKIITYTGDTEWAATLLDAAADADILIAEAYAFDNKIKFHLDAATLSEEFGRLKAKRIILTHLGPASLDRLADLPFEYAIDGKEISI